MPTKRRRAGAWQYTVRRKGLLPKPLYFTFDDEKEGDEYVRRLEALLDRGVVPEEFQQTRTAKRDLRSNVRRYLSAQHVARDDRKVLEVVLYRLPKTFDLAEVTFTWASAWVTALKREQNLSPSTIRKHVGALARAFDWLAAHGDLPMNPLRLLPKGYATYTPDDLQAVQAIEGGRAKHDTERDRRLYEGEDERIRAVMAGEKPEGRQRALELPHADSLRLLYDMALESAMRMREMYTLELSQVVLAKRTIFLDRTKNGSKRQVPITSVLAALLEAYLATYPDGFGGRLFPWWDGNSDPKELARVTSRLSRQFDRIFDAAGCKDLHFHDLRHEATSRLYERTSLSDVEIAKITGHTDLRMLKRYANLRGSTLAERLW